MTGGKRFPLLPHEMVFGAFLLVTWARLVAAVGPFGRDALVYAVFLAANVAVVAACLRRPTDRRWRHRLLYYPIAMNLVFLHLKVAVPHFHPGREDALLQAADRWLIGGNLSLWLQPHLNPFVTEFMSCCYFLFLPYLLFSFLLYLLGELDLCRRFYLGLFTIYGLGFFGYTLVPAGGPYLAMTDQFTVPLRGWWFTPWNAAFIARGSNGVDVFPSLHCAASLFMLLFDRIHMRWRFRLYLVPCVGLWASTIYLRYHYLVDVLVGFPLGAFALWVAERWRPAPAAVDAPGK